MISRVGRSTRPTEFNATIRGIRVAREHERYGRAYREHMGGAAASTDYLAVAIDSSARTDSERFAQLMEIGLSMSRQQIENQKYMRPRCPRIPGGPRARRARKARVSFVGSYGRPGRGDASPEGARPGAPAGAGADPRAEDAEAEGAPSQRRSQTRRNRRRKGRKRGTRRGLRRVEGAPSQRRSQTRRKRRASTDPGSGLSPTKHGDGAATIGRLGVCIGAHGTIAGRPARRYCRPLRVYGFVSRRLRVLRPRRRNSAAEAPAKRSPRGSRDLGG